MARNPTRFFYPHDFMRQDLGSLFVGYLAPRRLRELRQDYPQIFEVKKQGKYSTCRLKKETINEWYYDLSPKLRNCLRVEGYEPKETPEENVARLGLRFTD